MIEITTDMKAIIQQAILSFVATVNENGTPNLSPKASLTVADGVLYFADIFERRGYRFTGRASILPPGDDEYWSRASVATTT